MVTTQINFKTVTRAPGWIGQPLMRQMALPVLALVMMLLTGPSWATVPASPPVTGSVNVHVSVGPDGQLIVSDHVPPGAKPLEVKTYETRSDPLHEARARAERDYWRAQSHAFAQRQAARDRELAAERAAAARADRAALPRTPPWSDPPPRRYVRGAGGYYSGGATGVPGGTASTYTSSPGAASRAGAAFIGSGFATSR